MRRGHGTLACNINRSCDHFMSARLELLITGRYQSSLEEKCEISFKNSSQKSGKLSSGVNSNQVSSQDATFCNVQLEEYRTSLSSELPAITQLSVHYII